ncbi:SIR2 family protein [Brachymonas sp. G13]|uniref:SIR2 family protein n=1 Tax=Brachymonas wangyanguii TaxID=3130163 RepID=UPI00307ED8BF
MSLPLLTEEIAITAIRDFFRGKPFVFFGTGMSCAMDTSFGMPALRDELVEKMQERTLTATQASEWQSVVSALEQGGDLESSLNAVSDHNLLRMVTEITGTFVASLDRRFAYSIAQGSTEWPASRLLSRLIETLPESDGVLHVLTPNYDLLFEYACDFSGLSYTNGLFGGIERKEDWTAVDRALLEPCKIRQGNKIKTVYRAKKHARLYKVHGSLNYFLHRNAIIENNAWMWSPPEFAERVMITPGLSKYQALQRYRRELLQYADSAVDNATHFLFLGYGFNDSHLEEYVKRKLITQSSPGLIVTRDCNPRIESLLDQSENLWLFCKLDGEEGTKIFNKRYSGWLELKGQSLWDVRDFTDRIFGS